MHDEIEKYKCLEKLIFLVICAIMVYEFKSLHACVNNAKIYLLGLIFSLMNDDNGLSVKKTFKPQKSGFSIRFH